MRGRSTGWLASASSPGELLGWLGDDQPLPVLGEPRFTMRQARAIALEPRHAPERCATRVLHQRELVPSADARIAAVADQDLQIARRVDELCAEAVRRE